MIFRPLFKPAFAALALAATLSATTAHASIVFDNVNTAVPFGTLVESSGLLGMEFVPTQSGQLTSLQMALEPFMNIGQPHHATVTLYAGPQTTQLDSWSFDLTPDGHMYGLQDLTALAPHTQVQLTAGDDYWVFLSSPGYFQNLGVGWAYDYYASGTLYPSYGGGGGGYEFPGSAFDHQFELRVLTAVPEPATWALFILGFGGIGASLRGRRSRASAQFGAMA